MRCKNTKETNTTTNFKQVGAHKILGFSLKINEPKTPECGYHQIPRSESISRGQKEGGGLEARREKKEYRLLSMVYNIDHLCCKSFRSNIR